ncbi:MAG: Methyltransferase domain [Halomonas sp. HL-48]|nr:class I SAM-dependent methyltransferase [Halomonas sp. HL-48]KPQ23214.1 MAG: Methyltransferase domain [Halomonas sp. HL-48]
MQSKEHWERVYAKKPPTEVSWFQEHAALSVKLIRNADIPASSAIIDVGGGASTLVDDLLALDYEKITVLDLSSSALVTAKERLGKRASNIIWREENVLEAEFPKHGYDVWHDRAVFHFLTSQEERHRYVQKVMGAVKPGGLVMVATFAEDGPTQCSGLPVMRYSAGALHSEFGEPFELIGHEKETHHTPDGSEQKFIYCLCKKMM